MALRIYFDNCCLNRPFDNQKQLSVNLETRAKLHIQGCIKAKRVELVSSYVLLVEINKIRETHKRNSIADFLNENMSAYVGVDSQELVLPLANEIMQTGVKDMDAAHAACAILSGCGYLLTTDKRLLKYKTDKLTIINPIDFIKVLEDEEND
jgi:predicted nucleic acid-binding protein